MLFRATNSWLCCHDDLQGSPLEFEWSKPKLAQLQLDDTERARVFQKLAAEGMLLLTKQAELNKDKMCAMAEALCAHIEDITRQGQRGGAMWEEGVAEVNEIMRFWLMLLKPAAPVCLNILNSVMDANGGNKLLVQHAVQQSSFLHGLETQVRKSVVAHASLGPEVEKAVKDLEDGPGQERILQIIDKLPVYKDALRQGLRMRVIDRLFS
eukprot:6482185-Amphidinium_carterae.3